MTLDTSPAAEGTEYGPDANGDYWTEDGVSKPGGNIIPEAVELRFQANFNRWAVTSLDALDDAQGSSDIDAIEFVPTAARVALTAEDEE